MKNIFVFTIFILPFSLSAQLPKAKSVPGSEFSVFQPLYIVDGKIVPDLKSINPNDFDSITVLNGEEAIKKFGEQGKYGVIIAITKSAKGRESLDPKATEIWDLKPLIVTAGKNVGDAPSDAVILFDGKDLSKWMGESGKDAAWQVNDGTMTVVSGAGAIKTKAVFGDIQLHIEWRTPAEVKGEGQDRGNSGIFFQEQYELQVLDSYENQTYSNGQAGSIYKQHIPLVNVSRKPGEWQAYDVVYTAPRFSESNGRVVEPAYITVFQNGVLVQNHVAIVGGTQYRGLPIYKPHGKKSLVLQDHGTPVSYRNIWVREL